MSLINKMLQDLDARGTPRAGGVAPEIKPVAREAGRLPVRRLAAITAAILALALAATAWVVLPLKGKTYDVQAPAAPLASAAQATPDPVPVTVAELAPAAAGSGTAGDKAELAQAGDEASAAAPANPAAGAARAPVGKPQSGQRQAAATPAAVAPGGPAGTRGELQGELQGEPQGAGAMPQGRVETSSQSAENSYRRALVHLQDGRVGEVIAGLQATLRAHPAHEASRQTLVSLLIEANRGEEAVLQLQQALSLDARQPALAMLLARLQIERGKSGIDTLLRTLPYAAGNGDYHAFLAGALQRQARHAEAVEQYQAALRSVPGNAVWWMGLAISLQTDKRNAEAVDAFRQAKALGTLSGELQSFVERKLQQLAR